MWNRLKNLLKRDKSGDASGVYFLPQDQNPWGVPTLDVRPLTWNVFGASTDEQQAINSCSFEQEDGLVFVGMNPDCDRTVETRLRYATNGGLHDGVLYKPRGMDQKWALFYHDRQIICVRSWTRTVQVLADIEPDDSDVVVKRIHGMFMEPNESAETTTRMFDYLIQSHAMELVLPVPLPAGWDQNPELAAQWCFSLFGNMAQFATAHPLPWRVPEKPLASISMLHIATARQASRTIERYQERGIPVDARGPDGSTPLHWVSVQDSREIAGLLIAMGAEIDVQDSYGRTPLMWCINRENETLAAWFLEQGANVGAKNEVGATALHCAAELGNVQLVRLLLEAGADRTVECQGYTPRGIAEEKGHEEIVRTLSER